MADLVQWLRAQLDEDQWYAEEAATHAAATGTFVGKGTRWHAQDYDRLWAMGDDDSKPDRKLAECGHGGFRLTSYLARHDPARVLREVDAKRRIVDAYLPSGGDPHPGQPCINYEGQDPADYDGHDSCWRHLEASKRLLHHDYVLRLLALPYADRPGYLDSWRP